MNKTPTPASHAVNTAPISAYLRGMDDAGAQPEALRSALGPLINAFGEAQWQSGRGVPHPDLEQAFEAIIAAAQAHSAAQPSRECLQQSAAPVLTEQMAYDMGAKGAPATEAERVLFEAWMRGHCWALCAEWDGKGYRSTAEVGGDVDPRAMRTRQLFAAWRDRAALQAAPPVPEGMAVPAHDCCNSWFTSLSEGRQSVLRDDKWMLAHAAFDAGRAALAAAPAQVKVSQDHLAPAQEHATQLAGQGVFQQRVQPWMLACFGAEIASDKQERNHRFLEEAVELVQANGCTASEARQLVDYVFGRPVGEPAQEVGGVMVTLAALCLASGLDMHAAGETELARIWTKVDAIRAKQAAKPKHSPLPAAPVQAQEDQP